MLGISTTNARVGGFRGLGKIAKLILAYFARVIAASGVTEGKECLSNSLTNLDSKQLLDNASLVLIPSGYKESVLFSEVPTSGLGDLDVVRATTATRVNSAGLIELVPRNLLQYSNILTNSVWTKTNATITSGQVSPTQPNNEGWLINKTATGVDGTVYNTFALNSLNTHSYSYYILKDNNETRFPEFYLRINTGQFEQYVQVNTKTGALAVRIASAGCTQSITSTADNLWWRLILTNPAPTAFTADNRHGVRPAAATVFGVYNINATGSVITYGAQVESGSTATEYLPTVTRLNFPRLDYTNASCPSLLVEPQRTNLQAYSNDFNLWTLANTTVTANNGISPDGTQNADRVQFSTGGLMYYGSNGSAGSNTLTVYAKAKNGVSAKFRFFANGNTLLSSDQTATGTWQRFTFTYTYTALTSGLAIATTGADDILFYGFQHEIGSYSTSYIPTVAASVTRNADVISKSGVSSLIGQTEGTIYADFNFTQNVNTGRLIAIGDGDVNNRAFISLNANTITVFIRNVSAIQYSFTSPTILTGRYKVAVCYKQNDFAFYINGVQINTSSSGNVPINFNNFYLATNEFGATATEKQSINQAVIYKTRLTNVELASLTTL